MKKKAFLGIFALFMAVAAGLMAFRPAAPTPPAAIKWLSWSEAVELNKKQPKKIFVDVYTDWCGWCKVMDRETFSDPKISAYMAENFYCVKLNAEMRDDIVFDGKTFSFYQPRDASGNPAGRGVHTLAYALLDGQMSYPSVVYLTEGLERVVVSPGFKKPDQILPELKYTAENAYKTQSYNDYIKAK